MTPTPPLPTPSDQTFLDKYVSMCSLIIILVVLEAPLAKDLSDTFDFVSHYSAFGLWLMIQIWYIRRVYQFRRETARQMQLRSVAETLRQREILETQTGSSPISPTPHRSRTVVQDLDPAKVAK